MNIQKLKLLSRQQSGGALDLSFFTPTYWHVFLKVDSSGPGDGCGFGSCGGGGGGGDQGAGLPRLGGFGSLGLGLSLGQSEAAWCGDGTLHLHWGVP